jgi:16S rRNA (cytosine1402-N4)-methyltransferase
MEYRHTPVLLAEVTQHLSLQDGSVIVDCTLGGAGHAKRIQGLVGPHGTFVGIDKDQAALDAATDALRLGQHTYLVKGDFAELDSILEGIGLAYADGFLFDLGVSSFQLDAPERGFSYRTDAPLDMRMDVSSGGLTAADVVNTYEEADIARLIRVYGEDRWAARIANFIAATRARRPILSTGDLVEVVKAAVPASARRSGPHPARRTFQALRMEVNQELRAVETALEAAIRWLAPGGRIVVLSYHSLEDRLVKDAFRVHASGCECPPDIPECACGKVPVLKVITKKPVTPAPEEIESNPRAKSAKLRSAEKVTEMSDRDKTGREG